MRWPGGMAARYTAHYLNSKMHCSRPRRTGAGCVQAGAPSLALEQAGAPSLALERAAHPGHPQTAHSPDKAPGPVSRQHLIIAGPASQLIAAAHHSSSSSPTANACSAHRTKPPGWCLRTLHLLTRR